MPLTMIIVLIKKKLRNANVIKYMVFMDVQCFTMCNLRLSERCCWSTCLPFYWEWIFLLEKDVKNEDDAKV